MTVRQTLMVGAFVLLLAGVARGQSGAGVQAPAPVVPASTVPPLPAEQHPDISGIWNRLDTAGAESYALIGLTFPLAQLQPEYAAKVAAQPLVGPGPNPFVPFDRQPRPPTRCAIGGGGFNEGGGGINIDSSGMSLMVGSDEVLMIRDGAQGARHIRMDGKGFPDHTRMNGLFSIGRWQGDSLVVTTRGFTSGPTDIGRGWTESSTQLTETYELQLGGKRLLVTYTFTDPTVYMKPFIYHLEFERLASDVNIPESWCDAQAWMDWNAQQTQGTPTAPGATDGNATPAAAAQPASNNSR